MKINLSTRPGGIPLWKLGDRGPSCLCAWYEHCDVCQPSDRSRTMILYMLQYNESPYWVEAESFGDATRVFCDWFVRFNEDVNTDDVNTDEVEADIKSIVVVSSDPVVRPEDPEHLRAMELLRVLVDELNQTDPAGHNLKPMLQEINTFLCSPPLGSADERETVASQAKKIRELQERIDGEDDRMRVELEQHGEVG